LSTSIVSRQLLPLFVLLTTALPVFAHHEAIFGPQSATMISRRRFVSAQYYLTNEGRPPVPESRGQIGVLTVGLPIGERWSFSATLPIESEKAEGEARETGTQDLVFGLRRSFQLENGDTVMGVFTFEPPTTGTLEHRAIGFGGGGLYTREWDRWSAVAYGLSRTENSLEEGTKRGNRLFLGAGIAYEDERLPFAPQLGMSLELTGRKRENSQLVDESNSSVLFLHPTVVRDISSSGQAFFAFSVPVAQWSGQEGWQRWRLATGVIWSF
jgi:hypothetical protein